MIEKGTRAADQALRRLSRPGDLHRIARALNDMSTLPPSASLNTRPEACLAEMFCFQVRDIGRVIGRV